LSPLLLTQLLAHRGIYELLECALHAYRQGLRFISPNTPVIDLL
jgi:hypothetical protein